MSTFVPPPVSPPAYGQPPAPPPAPRRRSPLIWVLVGLLAVLAVLAVVVAASGVGAVRRSRVETQTYPQAIQQVSVTTTTGSILVRAGATGAPVQVQRTLEWSFGSASSQERVSGGVLDIQARCSSWTGLSGCSVSYVVTVPAGTALDLTSTTGSVQVRDVSGDVHATATTGSLQLTGLDAGTVVADTTTGSVLVGLTRPPTSVEARATTGSVAVLVPADGTAYAVQASTTLGSSVVQVPTDPASTHRILVSTTTGSVAVRSGS